jgi:tetratricopeptide (TPR) repeat protein
MKKILLSILSIICLIIFTKNLAMSQLSTPPPSPDAEWKQRLGFTYVSVAYERPLTRGRKIFGSLEPFGKVWRTGAGDCTTIKFSDDVEFGGQNVKKGKYSLFTIPEANADWAVILNTDTTQHGAFNYDEKKDVLRIKIKPETAARFYETFTIELTDIQKDYTGILALIWENTTIRIPLKSYADDQIMADIKDKIFVKKTENANLYYNAAGYYMSTNRDLKQALEWSQKAEAMDKENFYYVNQSTKILEALKDYKGAIVSAKRAVEVGTKKGFKSTAANWQKKIEEWEKL